MERKFKRLSGVLIAVLILLMALALAGCGEKKVPVDSATALTDALKAEGTQTISVDEAIVITEPLVVVGEKTIVGSGSITLNLVSEGTEEKAGGTTSLLGCPKLTAEDLSADAAVLQVESGAKLTLGGSVVVDGAFTGNGVLALGGATVNVAENAVVQNGKDCGVYVCENASLNVNGGSLLTSANHGVVNMGTMDVSGGTLSGAEKGAVIYSAGTLNITGGVVARGGVHNVYVAAGSVTMTGGKLEYGTKDGLVVATGATASVTGGTIENCGVHGLCNNGTMETGAVTLIECGITNNAAAALNMVDTTVEISAVYCLSNLGGTVTARNFSALSCDVTSVCNFAGDMTLENVTITGSRAGNISNESGNLTVNGATLGICREKPINVGSGVVRMDNVTVEGTTGEYFGAYIYGGEFYLNNSSIKYINYSALRADGQCYVELNNVLVDDTMASGIWARGATIVCNGLTLNNIRGHAFNNSGGNLTVNNLTATNIGKNAILQNNGTTTMTNVSFVDVGDQGAYVENGKLTITGGTFENVAQNGVYSRPDSTGEVVLKDVTYKNITKYGLNNGYIMICENVDIDGTGETGILNKNVMTLINVNVKNPTKDCIYNDFDAILKISNVCCYNSGFKSNPVYNRGEIHAFGLFLCGSHNYGLYNNKGLVTGDAITIHDTTKAGIYNVGGTVRELKNLSTLRTGDHAINNKDGEFTATNLNLVEITGEKSNAIYNTGTMNLENVNIDKVVSHAIFNKGTINGDGFTITNAGDVGFNNNAGGKANVANVNVTGGSHGVYNISEMTLTGGTFTNPGNNGIFIKEGGKLDLHGTVTVTGAKEYGLCNNASTVTGDADLIVTNVGGNGVYNLNGSLSLGNVTVSGANYGFSNTGTAAVASLSVNHTKTNGINNTKSLTVAGNVAVTDVYGATSGDNHGNGIYNTGTMSIGGELTIDNITTKGHTGNSANNAIFNRGTLNAGGNVTIGDVTAGHAILGTAGNINFPGTVTVNGTVGKDNIIYFYSSAKTAAFGTLVKTSDVAKVVLKVDGSTQLTVGGGEIKGGSGKDVVVANGKAVVTLNNMTVTGGNNVLHGAGGDIVASNIAISGCTIGINIRNAASQVTVSGVSTISGATHGSAVHVNSGGKLLISGGSLSIACSSGKNGVKVYNKSTLELAGGTLNITDPKTGISIDGVGYVSGDAASSINITGVAADGFAIENNGIITMNGTVSGTGADSADNALFKMYTDATFGALNVPTASAREALRAEKSAVVTVNGGVLNGSSKDVVVASNSSVINLTNVTVNGGNNALYGAGGDITATGVAISGSTIGINIRNAESQVTVSGTATISNVSHGSTIHVNKGGKFAVSGGSLTVNCAAGQNGVKIYDAGTVELTGGSLIISGPKTGINLDAGAVLIGDSASSITVSGASADGFAIENYGNITMNGTVTGTGADSDKNALFKMLNNATFGTLNVPTASAREMLRAEKSAVVSVYGGVIIGSSKDVVVASETSVINLSGVSVIGGNNALYGAGGDINAANVSVSGSTIGINIRNANSQVTLSGTNTFTNTTHGTCLHINSKGTLAVTDGAKLTLQWTDEALMGKKVGLKIYANSTLDLGANSTLEIIDCSKGWNVEAGAVFNRGEGATVTVNGTAA